MIESIVFHLFLVVTVAPLLPGVIARTKAVVAGRKGQPLLQLYLDLLRLFKKKMVISATTTWVFRAGPLIGIAVPLFVTLMIPFGGIAAVLPFRGDFILFVYLMALARFFTILAALDTGSSFEGMGAAREATFSILAEPAIFITFIALSRLAGNLSLNAMFNPATTCGILHSEAAISFVLIAFCLFIILLVENCRIPFDDPNTHLELTMIHEVMVLDHSGPDLGLILYGTAMKLMISCSLVPDLLLPSTGSRLLDMAAFTAGLIILAVCVGLVESGMARLRLIRVPQLLVGTSLLSFLALILLLR